MASYINNFGDYVTDYIVFMGKRNDRLPKIARHITAKCDYMAAATAERTTPGYIAFKVVTAESK